MDEVDDPTFEDSGRRGRAKVNIFDDDVRHFDYSWIMLIRQNSQICLFFFFYILSIHHQFSDICIIFLCTQISLDAARTIINSSQIEDEDDDEEEITFDGKPVVKFSKGLVLENTSYFS